MRAHFNGRSDSILQLCHVHIGLVQLCVEPSNGFNVLFLEFLSSFLVVLGGFRLLINWFLYLKSTRLFINFFLINTSIPVSAKVYENLLY